MEKNAAKNIGFGTQIRKSPFFDSTIQWGAKGFSVYNHMYIPRDFGNPEENFWNLVNDAILCDVSVERQVEITGPDAEKFVQYLTPRDISKCAVGQCKYVLITDETGGILNDPVLLRIGKNHFWLSLADNDILLWAKGVAINCGMDVNICEPDVSPLQLQGPKSKNIMNELFGTKVSELRYYWFTQIDYQGIPLVISRTGWSSELGYEIFLCDSSQGKKLWDQIMKVGSPLGLCPGHTSTIRRIEGGMLSYHADLDSQNNPFEMGLDRLVNLEKNSDFIGKEALSVLKKVGTSKKHVGLILKMEPLDSPNKEFWPIKMDDKNIGKVTSAVYSPRLKKNIALAIIDINFANLGTVLTVDVYGSEFKAEVTLIPFYDPKKQIAKI